MSSLLQDEDHSTGVWKRLGVFLYNILEKDISKSFPG